MSAHKSYKKQPGRKEIEPELTPRLENRAQVKTNFHKLSSEAQGVEFEGLL
jgi:hypothetical protein